MVLYKGQTGTVVWQSGYLARRKTLCSEPGCTTAQKQWAKDKRYRVTMTWFSCEKHGRIRYCTEHVSLHADYEAGGYRCLRCSQVEEQALRAQADADEREAERRNAEELREHPDPPDALPGYIAEFRSQGYGQAAAEALARKKVRETPVHYPERKTWTASDIVAERRQAERWRRFEAGVLAKCPKCSADVPASDGIVLAHKASKSENRGHGDSELVQYHCPGEGYESDHVNLCRCGDPSWDHSSSFHARDRAAQSWPARGQQ